MSRIPKWKIEKTKANVVFRLNFHATNIPQPGWDKLFISFFSLETGKVTAKTTKANVRNGICNWPDPIYETTRLLLDSRTKLYDEKLYKIVVAMGTSRSNILGEMNINLAEFVDACKPSSIQLPLEECEFGTILHVSVQLLTSKTGYREFEKQREFRQKGIHMGTEKDINVPIENVNRSAEAGPVQANKVQKRDKSKPSLRDLASREELGGSTKDCNDLAVGIDGSSCTSESVYTEKSDNNSTPELGGTSTSISGGYFRFSSGQSAEHTKDVQNEHQLLSEGSNDFSHGWISGYSIDNDLMIAREENNRLRQSLTVAEASISEMKMEVSSLQAVTEELSEETKNIVQQLVGELASGEALSKEICLLKSECLKLKRDLEEFRHSKDILAFNGGSHLANPLVLQPLSEKSNLDWCCNSDIHLKWLHGLTVIEHQMKEVQNKSELLYHGKDIDILNSNIQTLDSVVQGLKEVIIPPLRSEVTEVIHTSDIWMTSKKFETISTGHKLGRDSMHYLQQRVSEVLNELEISKIEQENLTKKMNKMENYYETLIQELEESHKNTLNELDALKSEHSSCFYTISSFQARTEKMHQEMNGQLSRFSDERHSLNSLNKELERRVNASEAMLKRIRQNSSIAVDRLQKDLVLLSGQVLSLFEANENLVKKAFSEASQFCLHELPDEHTDIDQMALHKNFIQATMHEGYLSKDATEVKSNNDPPVVYNASLKNGSDILQYCAISGQSRDLPQLAEIQIPKGDDCSVNASEKTPFILSSEESSASAEDIKEYGATENRIKSKHLQHLHLKTEAELYEIYKMNVFLEVFVKILQETLHDKISYIQLMKEEINRLSLQLDCSTKSNDTLMLELEDITENARILRDNEAQLATECNNLTTRNHILEAKLQDVAHGNTLLSERVIEFEKSILEYKEFETKYKGCDAEKMHLEHLLKKESAQKTSLQGELAFIMEECKSLRAELTDQCSVISSLEKAFVFANEKVDLLFGIASCDKQISEYDFANFSLELELKNKNYMAIMMHMERSLQEAYKKILQLDEEKKAIERERNTARGTLNSRECSLQEITKELHFTDAAAKKLQLELDEVVEKLMVSSEAENVHSERFRELLQKNMVLEVELEKLNAENRDLAKSLLRFESTNEELENAKMRLTDSMNEKEKLLSTIQLSNQASIQLQDAIKCLEEKLKCSDDGILSEKKLRLELEDTISELNSQLNDKCEQLLLFDKHKTEIANLRIQNSGLESHSSQMQKNLLQNEECQRKLNDEVSLLHMQVFNLEEIMILVKDNLQDICSTIGSIDKVVDDPVSANLELELENKNYGFIMMHLKRSLEWTHEKIHGQIQKMEEMKMQGDTTRGLLNDTAFSLHDCMAKLELSTTRMQELQLQLEDASLELKSRSELEDKHINENKELSLKITVLENELQISSCEKRDMAEKLLKFECIKEELEKAKLCATDCIREKENLMLAVHSAREVSTKMENELYNIKEKLKLSDDELQIERADREKLEHINSELKSQLNEKSIQLLSYDVEKSESNNLRLQISELEKQKSELQNHLLQCHGLQKKLNDENLSFHIQVSKQEKEIHILKESLANDRDELLLESSRREDLESKVTDLMLQVKEKSEQLLCFDEQKAELIKLRKHILDLQSETSRLNQLLSCNEECIMKLESEISTYNSQASSLENELLQREERLRSISDELLSERGLKEQLDIIVRDLRSQLNDKVEQILSFSEKMRELDAISHHVCDLEAENGKLQHVIFQSGESERKLSCYKDSLQMQISDLEAQILVIYECLLEENVKVIFVCSQFHSSIQILLDKLHMLGTCHKDLQTKNLDIIGSQQNVMSSKEENLDEHNSTSKFEFDACLEDKKPVDPDKSGMNYAQIETNYCGSAFMGIIDTQEQTEEDQTEKWRKLIPSFEDDVNSVRSFNYELDIIGLVLRSKLNEQKFELSLLESYGVELMKLREQNNELNLRLSEQILKTEEFKNLSIHLKDLKDKADAECLQAREKKGTEGPPSVQESESLRMAFIKEQCETEVLELRNQLHMSKMHGDELLLKLQNAIDEIEMRKKSEAVHCKRNEDMSKKVTELEAEMQRVLTSRREFLTTYDEMKAELECSIISLDCCKEEKAKLEGQLHESNEENAKLKVELDLIKRRMEILTSASDYLEIQNNNQSPVSASFERFLEQIRSDVIPNSPNAPTANFIDSLTVRGVDDMTLTKAHSEKHELSNNGSENLHKNLKTSLDNLYDNNLDIAKKVIERKSLSVEHNNFEEQNKEKEILKSKLKLLHDELEDLKNENLASLLPLDGHHLDPEFVCLEKELSQLSTVNECLSNMFPSFEKFPGNKNAMQRVLALELEFSEALQKKKSDNQFQSSFLRQHSDEEAIFQSFRDINELIKDTLEIKGRHATVEAELKEMHSRYSDLSLQFAEVEGERQKLAMIVKNRAPRRQKPSANMDSP